MAETTIVHRGKVDPEIDKLYFDNLHLWKRDLMFLRGKRFELRITEEDEEKTKSQLGFLFAGIIRSECMNHEAFTYCKEEEILRVLESECSYEYRVIFIKGEEVPKKIVIPVESMGKKKLKQFIDRVIAHLYDEYQIIVKDPKIYNIK